MRGPNRQADAGTDGAAESAAFDDAHAISQRCPEPGAIDHSVTQSNNVTDAGTFELAVCEPVDDTERLAVSVAHKRPVGVPERESFVESVIEPVPVADGIAECIAFAEPVIGPEFKTICRAQRKPERGTLA